MCNSAWKIVYIVVRGFSPAYCWTETAPAVYLPEEKGENPEGWYDLQGNYLKDQVKEYRDPTAKERDAIHAHIGHSTGEYKYSLLEEQCI